MVCAPFLSLLNPHSHTLTILTRITNRNDEYAYEYIYYTRVDSEKSIQYTSSSRHTHTHIIILKE